MTKKKRKRIHLLGTRGLPAAHGGFETFVANLAPYLVEHGWEVDVYCQHSGRYSINNIEWKGINLVNISIPSSGTLSTIIFDLVSLIRSLTKPGLLLSFGYPTGLFAIFPRILGRKHLINMDGIEWKRSQFGLVGKVAYYVNEKLAAIFANKLIADHPEIKLHLSKLVSKNKITMIPYGAEKLARANIEDLEFLNLKRNNYGVIVARPEPDNSILEIVRAFSSEQRGLCLVVLGNYSRPNAYQKAVIKAASREVIFAGAIYEYEKVFALRKYSLFYAHGHKVGGTNPSLVEALAAGCPIIAHNNKFNTWVARDAAVYFDSEADFKIALGMLSCPDFCQKLRNSAALQFQERFTWEKILQQYRLLLAEQL